MKVKVNIVGTVSYNTQIEMSEAEFELWQKKIDDAHNSYYRHTVAERLLESVGLEVNKPTDWLPLRVDTLEPVKPYKCAPP